MGAPGLKNSEASIFLAPSPRRLQEAGRDWVPLQTSCRTSTKRGRGRITGSWNLGACREAPQSFQDRLGPCRHLAASFRTPNLQDAHRLSRSQIERASRATSQLLGGLLEIGSVSLVALETLPTSSKRMRLASIAVAKRVQRLARSVRLSLTLGLLVLAAHAQHSFACSRQRSASSGM